MSDPVSNAEIEDVLSSIRRLISESKATDERADSGKTEKLVLTPAFRVHDEGSKKAADRAPDRDLEQKRSAASNTLPQNPPAEKADIGEDDRPNPVFSHRGYSPPDDGDVEEMHTDLSATSDDAVSRTGRVSNFQDPTNQRQDLWEADGGDETTQTDVLMFHAARLRSEDEHVIVGESNPGDWSDESDGGEADEAPFVAVDDSADERSLPPADTVHNRDEHMTPIPTGREVEIVGDDTDIIDEEVVQAMVARLVREELQGEVGEKITQSIRRFVRREIERALTLKGLE